MHALLIEMSKFLSGMYSKLNSSDPEQPILKNKFIIIITKQTAKHGFRIGWAVIKHKANVISSPNSHSGFHHQTSSSTQDALQSILLLSWCWAFSVQIIDNPWEIVCEIIIENCSRFHLPSILEPQLFLSLAVLTLSGISPLLLSIRQATCIKNKWHIRQNN